jgi:hypothetical protein
MVASAIPVERRSASASRLPALGGIAFVVIVVAALLGLSGDTPGTGDSAVKINAFYDAHHTNQIIASLLVAAAVPLLVIFGITLASALWPTDAGRRPVWQILLTGGTSLAGATWLVAALLHFALTDAADQKGISAGALQALNVLDADSWVAFNSGMGVMMLGAGGALLARKVHPALAWIALVDGILLFIPFADFFGLILSGLWIIVTSVLLFRRGSEFALAR